MSNDPRIAEFVRLAQKGRKAEARGKAIADLCTDSPGPIWLGRAGEPWTEGRTR